VVRRGLHNQRKRNINQLFAGTLQGNPGVNANALRPFLGMGIIGISENSGLSEYHGLQVSIERHAAGLQYGIAYTYSKLKDNGSDLTELLPNAYDDRDYWGTSNLDRTHVLIVNYIYELPLLRRNSGLLQKIAGDWQISGVSQFQSGLPFSVRDSTDFAGVGGGSGNQFWNLVGNANAAPTKFTNSAVWFNSCRQLSNGQLQGCAAGQSPAWVAPAAGTFGRQPKNSLYNPGFRNVDAGLRKNIRVAEKQSLQLRWEVYNLFNHPNWNGANSNPTSGSFGTVTSKSGNRLMQLAVKYIF